MRGNLSRLHDLSCSFTHYGDKSFPKWLNYQMPLYRCYLIYCQGLVFRCWPHGLSLNTSSILLPLHFSAWCHDPLSIHRILNLSFWLICWFLGADSLCTWDTVLACPSQLGQLAPNVDSYHVRPMILNQPTFKLTHVKALAAQACHSTRNF